MFFTLIYNETTKEAWQMRKQKYYVYLEREETGIVIQSLNRLRNAMLRENRDTDCVDALLLKVMSAPVKKL